MILLIRFYQTFLSPLCPGVCRFRPTCSEYFIQALKTHGIIKGSYLGIRRIRVAIPGEARDMIRCRPKQQKSLIKEDKRLP